jgi:hypothetical protein
MDTFCSSCGENDLTAEDKTCSKCTYKVCSDCLLNSDICKFCLGDLCPVCGKTSLTDNFNEEKHCYNCDRICCIKCIALTGCQTTQGICKQCFNYKCQKCNEVDLPGNILYIEDIKKYSPICGTCMVIDK